LPYLDRILSALFDDLQQRGLWDTTLVMVNGDMGRTPRINANAGRDHWPQCGFCLFAGGGVKQGYVHGRSDRQGGYPVEFPVTPGDLCATVYHLLGLDSHMMVPDQTGRPLHVAHGGEPIRGILE
jgi:arylsulfatase A-like enzyme